MARMGVADLTALAEGRLFSNRVRCIPENPPLKTTVELRFSERVHSATIDNQPPFELDAHRCHLQLDEDRPYVVRAYNKRGRQLLEKTIQPAVITPELKIHTPERVTFAQSGFELGVAGKNIAQQKVYYRLDRSPLIEVAPEREGHYLIPILSMEAHRIEVLVRAESEDAQYTESAKAEKHLSIQVEVPDASFQIMEAEVAVNQAGLVKLKANWLSHLSIRSDKTGKWLYQNNQLLSEPAVIELPAFSDLERVERWNVEYQDLSGKQYRFPLNVNFYSRPAKLYLDFNPQKSVLELYTEGLSRCRVVFPARGVVIPLDDSLAHYEIPISHRSSQLKGRFEAVDDSGELYTESFVIPAQQLSRLSGC